MAWQDFLNTPGAKEYYIRSEQFLDIDAPKSSKAYRNAYRYLDLIATGKRSGQVNPDYKAIVDDAKRLDAITRRLDAISRRPPQPPSVPHGRQPVRLYVPGRTKVIVSGDVSYRDNFGLDMDIHDQSGILALDGDYTGALHMAFYEQVGMPVSLFRADGGPLVDSDVRPVF